RHERLARQARALERARGRARVAEDREQQMLDADEVVLQRLRLVFRRLQQLPQARRDVDLGVRARDLWQAVELALDRRAERRGREAGLLEHRRREASLLREQRGEEVFGLDRLVALPVGER